LEEDIIDGSSDEGSQVEEFTIDTVKGSLEEVSFSRVFRVEEFQELQDKAVIDVSLGYVGVEVLTLDEPEEELIYNLDMRPGNFQDRFIFFGVKCLALRIHWRWNRAEQVLGEHLDDTRIHWFSDDLTVVGDVIEKLVES
jgi:hypothetical protein